MSPVTPSAGVHPVYHTPARQRNPLCAASLRTPAGVPRTLPSRPSPARTPLRTHTPAYPLCPSPPAATHTPVHSTPVYAAPPCAEPRA
ncbi:hypothetical protein CM00_gp95 [Mycobacterium phage Kugel]|uniref:Uncharacterized protein n=1 Tax=Mycobacterium phage Kugel TaxID=2923003 RepID=G8IBD3_9CAUD|nr:hypothetical protein CM00_gp95 [Mycobacterium phage Kugel]AER50026.1 hypothetical protein KUGEL_95 [Mycobacterium phage Kugel]